MVSFLGFQNFSTHVFRSKANPAMDESLEKLEAQAVSVASSPTPEGNMATEDEIRDLRHVSAPLPLRVWLAASIGMAERFSYYGTQTLFRQYTPFASLGGAMRTIFSADATRL